MDRVKSKLRCPNGISCLPFIGLYLFFKIEDTENEWWKNSLSSVTTVWGQLFGTVVKCLRKATQCRKELSWHTLQNVHSMGTFFSFWVVTCCLPFLYKQDTGTKVNEGTRVMLNLWGIPQGTPCYQSGPRSL